MKIKSLIIGLGNIGMNYDVSSKSNKIIYTHAKALKLHKKYKLLAGIDVNDDKRKAFKNSYNLPAYNSISKSVKQLQPDLVIISTDTLSHLKILKNIIKSNFIPKFILCEKPMGKSLNEAKKIVKICDKFKIKLFVNYIRRSDPGVKEIKDRIIRDSIRPPLRINLWYTKGLINNCSHFINLLEFILGNVKEIKLINKGRRYNSYDREPEFELKFKHGNSIFRPAWIERYDYTNMEIISQTGRLMYSDGGSIITWQEIESDGNGNNIKKRIDTIENKINTYQYQVYEELSKSINNNNNCICTGRQALKTHKIINEILSINEK